MTTDGTQLYHAGRIARRPGALFTAQRQGHGRGPTCFVQAASQLADRRLKTRRDGFLAQLAQQLLDKLVVPRRLPARRRRIFHRGPRFGV